MRSYSAMSTIEPGRERPRRRLGSLLGWQLLVTGVATVYAAFVPADIVFHLGPRHPLFLLHWFAPAVFLTDTLVTTRLLKIGDSTPAFTRMAESRFSRWALAADMVAWLPLSAIFQDPALGLLGVVKLVKVVLLMHLWRRLGLRFSSRLLLLYGVYWISLSGHWLSLGWLDLRGAEPGASRVEAYVDAVYWTVTTVTSVGYGDVTPETFAQKLFAIGTMILGLAFLGYLVGVIASALSKRDPATARFLDHVEQLGQATRYWNLPRDIEQSIYDYHYYVWKTRFGYDEGDFLKALPKGLKGEVSLHLKREVIERVDLFREADPEFLRDAALRLHPEVLTPGQRVVETGEHGEEMYFVVRGELDVLGPDGQRLARLAGGDFFGEIALFTGELRTASVQALTYCDVYVLSKASFRYLSQRYPEVHDRIKAKAVARARRTSALLDGD
jgi:voltage-gated potassium channel